MLCRNKTRTVGVMLASFNCGIITSYREIFRCESLIQTSAFLLDTFDELQEIPNYIIYDTSCKLCEYIKNECNLASSTERAKLLKDKTFVVDRFHFLNHVGDFCTRNCDPKLYDDLKNINTSVSEEINFWFSKFKYIVKHMNLEHFSFFLFIIFNEYNTIKLESSINILD